MVLVKCFLADIHTPSEGNTKEVRRDLSPYRLLSYADRLDFLVFRHFTYVTLGMFKKFDDLFSFQYIYHDSTDTVSVRVSNSKNKGDEGLYYQSKKGFVTGDGFQ